MPVSFRLFHAEIRANADVVLGFGGNSAIESAAALANSIKKLSDKSNGGHPSEQQIIECLQNYQKSREVRAAAAIEASNLLTHIQALATWAHSFFAHYGLRILGDFFEGLQSDMSIGATLIDFLPPPDISLIGNMPFNPEQGQGHKESLPLRALFALPFLVLFAAAWRLANVPLLHDSGSVTGPAWYNDWFAPSSLTWSTLGFGSQNNGYVRHLILLFNSDLFQDWRRVYGRYAET